MSTLHARSGDSDFDDVGAFHHKFGLYSVTHDGPYPQRVSGDLLAFRLRFLLEELQEFMEAVDAHFVAPHEPDGNTGEVGVVIHLNEDPSKQIDHAQAFDALIDLVYVALGTAHLFGYPWAEGWHMVQTANMKKIRAQADGSDSKRGSSFDVVKPEGWQPPNIGGLLEAFGFPVQEDNE